MRPHIFVTAEKTGDLRSVDELREGIRTGHAKTLWEAIRSQADADCSTDPLIPSSVIPGREDVHIRHANRDWTICNAAGQRVQTAAIAALITSDTKYRDSALRQMDALFDRSIWPEWRDQAPSHQRFDADLRTGMLGKDLSLAYDWLYPHLSSEQKEWIISGIDDMGIQPYLRAVDAGAWWANGHNNWLTVVVGGMGIAGMALAEDHPQSLHLVNFAHPRMVNYLKNYGPEGEFNESVAYANATLYPVAYFTAHRYATGGGDNRLSQWPFPDTCIWSAYFTLPPGRVAAFGDSHLYAPPFVTYLSAVADATQNGIIQWFYLQNILDNPHRNLPWELLWYNANLKPVSPEGHLPKGRAYPAHNACISVRTDWNPRTTDCVVYGKAGHGAEGHGNHDIGQVCIDACGERLIVDLGSPPGYPADFFGETRYKYYNASVIGHNLLTIGNRETKRSSDDQAKILNAEFDDAKGGHWTLDLTPLYEQVQSVHRTVAFLSPGIIAVLDTARCNAEEDIVLRWHTISPSEPDANGHFTVQGEKAALTAQIVRLYGNDITFSQHRHAYHAPYNRFRLGDVFEQRHEPFVQATVQGRACRLLTLFSVYPDHQAIQPWQSEQNAWTVQTPDGAATVTLTDAMMQLKNAHHAWEISL